MWPLGRESTGARMDYPVAACTREMPRVRAKLCSRSRSACIYGYNLMQERRTHLASLLDTQIVLPDVI